MIFVNVIDRSDERHRIHCSSGVSLMSAFWVNITSMRWILLLRHMPCVR